MVAPKATALPLGHTPTFQRVFYSINCLNGERSKLLTKVPMGNSFKAHSAVFLLEKETNIVDPVPVSLGMPTCSSKEKVFFISGNLSFAQSEKLLMTFPFEKSLELINFFLEIEISLNASSVLTLTSGKINKYHSGFKLIFDNIYEIDGGNGAEKN